MAEDFQRAVVDDFAAEYADGRTPNPCARCNEQVKVVGLLARARALGFDALATGHYARVEGGRLYRGADAAKDQSYVLYMLGPAELEHLRLPLGGLTKPEVRAIAARLGLRTAAKPESYDVCFVPDGDTAGWLERRFGPRPGQVVDTAGRVLGSTGAPTATRSASGAGSGSPPPPPATCSGSNRRPAGSWWGSGPSWPSPPSSWTRSPPPTAARCAKARPRSASAPTAPRSAPGRPPGSHEPPAPRGTPGGTRTVAKEPGSGWSSMRRSTPSPPGRPGCCTTATWSSAAAP